MLNKTIYIFTIISGLIVGCSSNKVPEKNSDKIIDTVWVNDTVWVTRTPVISHPIMFFWDLLKK
jgi:hypothetical protein